MVLKLTKKQVAILRYLDEKFFDKSFVFLDKSRVEVPEDHISKLREELQALSPVHASCFRILDNKNLPPVTGVRTTPLSEFGPRHAGVLTTPLPISLHLYNNPDDIKKALADLNIYIQDGHIKVAKAVLPILIRELNRVLIKGMNDNFSEVDFLENFV